MKSLETAINAGTVLRVMDAYNTLSQIYVLQENYEKACNYQHIATAYKDSLFDEEKSRQIAELQTIYETGKINNNSYRRT